ncbi:hypothetical protein FQK02_02600 [Xanthomonas vasicola]|uniref:hypothetical protein n=1 Tax=Xanthomonas vasicola TaxID=56459 RepID=UPI0003622E4A|nr:hypothetical protein [Xanthomonas vasicola]KFA22524.1 hypothetical protein KW5_0123560 [Xanthomonas vasicola pv. vasculorum NCPPB 1326]KFA32234.1 hypothetical protein KWG_0108535 [Xanthomonas vasicola pv. vasculorum NCPPB 1381]TWQ07877.1 hypothetical protein FQK02_02600 [Xanthomonas vasicola]
MNLELASERATELLAGKAVKTILHHRPGAIVIQFKDGSRLFVDANGDALELSITGCTGD